VDRARAHRIYKRSGPWARDTLDPAHVATHPAEVDVLDLDTAVNQLAAFDPRKSRIAELRFFGGLSLDEAEEVLGVSIATVERDWQAARAWLFKVLAGAGRTEPWGGRGSRLLRAHVHDPDVSDVVAPGEVEALPVRGRRPEAQ
jgi:DNA-directed RNA polymerase specialized sigma24 family protein